MTLAVVNEWKMFAGYVVMKPSMYMDLSKTEKVICNFTNTEIAVYQCPKAPYWIFIRYL